MADQKVFLCHNSQDKSEVRIVRDILAENDIEAWLDEDELLVGHSWYEQIFNKIGDFSAMAVFIGPYGIGDVQKQEIRNALRNFEKQGKPVIPVILKGYHEAQPEIPPFIKDQLVDGINNVDFGIGRDIAIRRLVAGVRRVPPRSVELAPSDAADRLPDSGQAKRHRPLFRLAWIALHLIGFVAISLLSESSLAQPAALSGVLLVTSLILGGLLLSGRRQALYEGVPLDYTGAAIGFILGIIGSGLIIQQAPDQSELLKAIGALATATATGALAGSAGGWPAAIGGAIVASLGASGAAIAAPLFSIASEGAGPQIPTGMVWAALLVGTIVWATILSQFLIFLFSNYKLVRSIAPR